MAFLPTPQAAWSLDGSVQSSIGGSAATLHGECNWTQGHTAARRALSLSRSCYGAAEHTASLVFGSSSFSACARFRSVARGAPLFSKFGRSGATARGFSIELGEERGLGIGVADGTGVSVHEELGRSDMADGAWHHACVVLQRTPRPLLSVYADGALSESMSLQVLPSSNPCAPKCAERALCPAERARISFACAHRRASRLRHLGALDCDAPLLMGRHAVAERDSLGGGQGEGSALADVAVWSRALLPEHVSMVYRHGLSGVRQPSRHRKRLDELRGGRGVARQAGRTGSDETTAAAARAGGAAGGGGGRGRDAAISFSSAAPAACFAAAMLALSAWRWRRRFI